MELVDGEDLSQRIARGAMPLDEALPIAKQIAEALKRRTSRASFLFTFDKSVRRETPFTMVPRGPNRVGVR